MRQEDLPRAGRRYALNGRALFPSKDREQLLNSVSQALALFEDLRRWSIDISKKEVKKTKQNRIAALFPMLSLLKMFFKRKFWFLHRYLKQLCFSLLYVYLCTVRDRQADRQTTGMWRSKVDLWEPVFFFPYVDPGDRTQVWHCYLLGHLCSPLWIFCLTVIKDMFLWCTMVKHGGSRYCQLSLCIEVPTRHLLGLQAWEDSPPLSVTKVQWLGW